MSEYLTLEVIDQTVAAIRKKIDYSPRLGLILGSGLGPLANSVEDAIITPYSDLPNWPPSTVPGHYGRLVIGRAAERELIEFLAGLVDAQDADMADMMMSAGIDSRSRWWTSPPRFASPKTM